ncbi:MAG: hypothetical protein JW981_01230, partial [Anaerolineae bacterium]|nr:hypothetical protein [Anaerolineae bacterium]
NLQKARIANDLFATRWAGFKMMTAIIDCLAMVNQTFFAKFWVSNLEPVAQLSLKPDGLLDMVEIISTSGDLALIQETAESLVAATRSLLLNEQHTIKCSNTVDEIFGGFYAGIKEYVNKILSACEKRNMVAVSYDAAYLQSDMASMLVHAETGVQYTDFNIVSEYRRHFDQLQFPDLSEVIAKGDFDAIKEQIQLFDERSQEYFACNSVDMNVIESMESLKAFIERKP